jgi:hypothetical protein
VCLSIQSGTGPRAPPATVSSTTRTQFSTNHDEPGKQIAITAPSYSSESVAAGLHPHRCLNQTNSGLICRHIEATKSEQTEVATGRSSGTVRCRSLAGKFLSARRWLSRKLKLAYASAARTVGHDVTGRHSHGRGSRRHIFYHHGIGSNANVVADSDRAEDSRPGRN